MTKFGFLHQLFISSRTIVFIGLIWTSGLTYGIWGLPTKEILERQADQVTDLQKSAGLESYLPIEIQNERDALQERDRERGLAEERSEEQVARTENVPFVTFAYDIRSATV